MRILVVSNVYPPVVMGGYELGCADTVDWLRSQGHDVRVLTSWDHASPSDRSEPDWVHRDLDLRWHLHSMPGHSPVRAVGLFESVISHYSNTRHLIGHMEEFRPDVVYLWNLMGVGTAALIDVVSHSGVPWALHLMDRYPVDPVMNFSPDVLGVFAADGSQVYSSALVFAMSQHLVDEIEAEAGVTFDGGVSIIPGGVDLSSAQPHEPYLRDGIARFVTAGAVRSEKGLDVIVSAAAELRDRGVDFLIDVYGSGDIHRYVALTRALSLDDKVRFLGPRTKSELIGLYSGYDAFLFPTWSREPYGFAPVEAAGCGTPPLMTRGAGSAERLVDRVHCVKIDRTVPALADAMADVASGRTDLAAMGSAGQRLCRSDLTTQRWMAILEQELEKHLAQHGPTPQLDPALPLLSFLKHNLAVTLQFDGPRRPDRPEEKDS